MFPTSAPTPATETQSSFSWARVRPVYEVDGRQFVITDDGERVYGVWYIPPDDGPVPLVVDPNDSAEDF
jgi:hypothetical protein